MKNERIPFSEIQKIAQEVTQEYNPIELPSLEQISWAFPVDGQERVHYCRNGYMERIPNTQEGNAMKQLMTFKNFRNVLQYLTEGKTVSRGCIPNHTFPCGDADDGAYMIYPYMKQEDLGKEGKSQDGFFWETLPSELVKAVFKVERTGRGKLVDANGEEIERLGNNAYVNENLTKQYIQSLMEAYDLGREYLRSVTQSVDQKGNYDQLIVDANPENWRKGQEFQQGLYVKENPALVAGKILSNDGRILKAKVWDIGYPNENVIWDEEIEEMKKFGEHGLLWRLVPSGEKR